MSAADDTINALRTAVRISPDNLPLRQALAELLLSHGRYDDAEREFKQALSLAPADPAIKLSLASVYFQQDKNSHALVIVEDLLKSQQPPAKALLLHAKLLARAGDIDHAVRQYKRARDADPAAEDPQFAARLGVPSAQNPVHDTDELSEGRLRNAAEDPDAAPASEIERPKIAFANVGGMDAVKDEIRIKIIHPLQHPDLYKAYGKTAGGGILLYGPPGCGKTHLARATAGEIKAGFLSVGINDVLNMWLGNSEKNLHELFDQARNNTPCVLFFDEVDALAASRADMRTSAGRHLINQFLSELDGISAKNDGLLILAATNAPWHIDPAFRRPGRFDRILFVPPPDPPARSAILRIMLKGKPLEEIDYDAIVKKTDAFSGADLKGVVDLAIEKKLHQAIKEGTPKPITTKDLLTAAAAVKSSTREWFATARNYALYSNQGGTYDDILKHLNL